MRFSFKKILPHVFVLLGFIIISLAYFSPVLKGKAIYQSDIVQYIGMSKQQKDFKAETGTETYWTNSAFGGMPTYQLGARYPHNYIKKLDLALRFLPRPADYLFLYLLSFYVFLLVLKVDFKLAILGALAFGFSTYLIIILGVGHNSKAHALSVALNATNFLATSEYVKESKRSKSELIVNPDGSPKEVTSGLDKDYITQFSYGIVETFNLFIPRFMGGGNGEDVGKDSATYEAFRKLGASTAQATQEAKRAPTYWGDQPIVEAPAYVGAVILFLFVFALFLVKGRLKWWLVGGTLFSLLLSYGKNLGFLTDFFIDYMPFYDKFRAVSSIQVLLELCIPSMAIFGLVRLFNDFESKEDKLKALKYAAGITGGIALVFLLFKSTLFDFVGINDGFYRQNYGPDFVDALKADRKTIFTQDTIRTLVLVLLSAGAIYLFLQEKLKERVVIIVFGALILFDLVGVDRRYVNNDDFVSGIKMNKPFQASQVDKYILKDTVHFRDKIYCCRR